MSLMVIYSHAYILGGWGHDPIGPVTRQQESFGGFAVVGFFAMSGFLVSQSAGATDFIQFIWRRFLRVFPGFWVALVVSAFVLVPIIWRQTGMGGISDYLSLTDEGPVSYVLKNLGLVIHQSGIADIFRTAPSAHAGVGWSNVESVNASLWTLEYEWRCYLLIAALSLFGVIRKMRVFVPVLAAILLVAMIAGQFAPDMPPTLLPFMDDKFGKLALAFLVGSSLAMYADRIPLDARLGWFSWVVVIVSLWSGGWSIVGIPAAAYGLIWAAAALPKFFQRVGAKNDYSYGLYIYGFVIQQTTVALGWNSWGFVPWLLTTIVLSFGFAWLSWHIIEKHAMKLKSWGPGRGIGFWRQTWSGVGKAQ